MTETKTGLDKQNTDSLIVGSQQAPPEAAGPPCANEWHGVPVYAPAYAAVPKAKAYNTHIAPHAAYCSCSGAFVSQTERPYWL